MQLNKCMVARSFLKNFFVEQDVGMQMEKNGVSLYIQFEAFGQKFFLMKIKLL